MSMNDDEMQLDRALRALPPRRAPASLEAWVLGELERRAALPWWRRSFSHWPLAARAAFLVVCAASIRLVFLGSTTATAGVRSLSWAREIGLLASTGSHLAALIAPAGLPGWLSAGAAFCAVLYAVLFGLGAAVYRTLYLRAPSGNSIS